MRDGINYGIRGGSADSAIHNAEAGTFTIALGLLVKYVGEKATKHSKEKNEEARNARIAYHVDPSEGLNK